MAQRVSDDADEGESRSKVAEAWPGLIVEDSGFVALPMALLRLQAKLELTPTDFGVLANILAHRWKAGDVVFPRTTTIAKRMGVTVRTVQRSTTKLAKLGYIEKVITTNGMRAYDATPLVGKLKALMPEAREIKSGESLGA